jgi:hypothetical protein
MSESGRLIGIAVRDKHRAPMQTRDSALVSVGAGVEGDFKGIKHPRRGVSVLSREAWEAALAELGDAEDLDWTKRRANLLVEGIELPRALGGIVRIGPALSHDAVPPHG